MYEEASCFDKDKTWASEEESSSNDEKEVDSWSSEEDVSSEDREEDDPRSSEESASTDEKKEGVNVDKLLQLVRHNNQFAKKEFYVQEETASHVVHVMAIAQLSINY